MTAKFNNVDWSAGITFASSQYAQQFNQLLADIFAAFKYGAYFLTGTSGSTAPATGSQTWTTAVDTNFLGVGSFVIIASNANPSTNWCAGYVTAVATNSLTAMIVVARGTAADTNWNIVTLGEMTSAAPGSTRMGQTGQTTAAGVLSALGLDTPASVAEGIADDFNGASVANGFSGGTIPITSLAQWLVTASQNAAIKPNAAPYYSFDAASHPGVIAAEVISANDQVRMRYCAGNNSAVIQNRGYACTAGVVLDVIFMIPSAFTAQENVVCRFVSSSFVGDRWGFSIGETPNGVLNTPMRLFFYGPSIATDTGYDFKENTWYRVRAERDAIYVFASDGVKPADATQNQKKTLYSQTGMSVHAFSDPMNLDFTFTKLGSGSAKKAILIDAVRFTPAPVSR